MLAGMGMPITMVPFHVLSGPRMLGPESNAAPVDEADLCIDRPQLDPKRDQCLFGRGGVLQLT